MTHAIMDTIEGQDAVVREQGTYWPGFKLFGEALVEPAPATCAGSHSHERLSDLADLMGTGSGNNHLRQSVGDLLFIALIPVKELSTQLPRTISGHFLVLTGATGRCQITGVETSAVAFAFRDACSPGRADTLRHFFTYDLFHDHSCCLVDVRTQILMKFFWNWHVSHRWFCGSGFRFRCGRLFLIRRQSSLLVREKILASTGQTLPVFSHQFTPANENRSSLHTTRHGVPLSA